MIIFIVSNEPKTIRFLTGAVKTYSEQKYVDIEVKVFRNVREYLLNFDTPDLIFIDDSVEMKPSVETARIVRSKDAKASIVLLSASPERVFEAFSVKTHRFLTKPITRNDVFQAIDSYRKDVVSYRVIIVKVHDAFRVFTSEEIFAVISDGPCNRIMTRDEMVEILTPFAKVEEQLPEEYFFKCHRSYLVNMRHIARFQAEQIELTNHAVLPLSRRKKSEFHIRYTEFVKGHTFLD